MHHFACPNRHFCLAKQAFRKAGKPCSLDRRSPQPRPASPNALVAYLMKFIGAHSSPSGLSVVGTPCIFFSIHDML